MSVSITPKFENSKFKVSFSVCTSSTSGSYGPRFRLQRDGTDLDDFISSSSSSRENTTITTAYPTSGPGVAVSNFTALDNTSYEGLTPIVYSLDWAQYSGTAYLNRTNTDSNSFAYVRTVSEIMVEEIYQ